MPELISDESFVRNVLRVQLLTEDRIQHAKDEQFRLARRGEVLPLAEVLVRLGELTPVLRERIEKMPAVRAAGVQILGPFKLLRQIGEGSMGTVYLALDTRTDRRVALKTLPKKYAEDSEFLARFQREARAAKTIVHENIVAAYESGEDQGYHYFAMEFCKGEALDRILEREKSVNWLSATRVILQVAHGLECAHLHGFIHRDVKPGNIILVASIEVGQPPIAKVLDLGLTKNILYSQSTFRTEAGAMLGTPQYISPEQARGDERVDGRSDIYSLGATFYHIATGAAPFEANSAEHVIQKHLSEPLSNPQDIRPDIPDGVAQVIQRMMAKEPDDRYADCTALIRDLERVIAGKPPVYAPVAAGRTTVAERTQGKRFTYDPQLNHETLYLPAGSSNDALLSDTLAREPKGDAGLLINRILFWGLAGLVVFAIGFGAVVYVLSKQEQFIPVDKPPKSPGVHASPLESTNVTVPVEKFSTDILVNENFDAFNLAEVPAGWGIHKRENVTIESAVEHGNVLRVVRKADDAGNPGLEISLKVDRDAGRLMRAAVLGRIPNGAANKDEPSRLKAGISITFVLSKGANPADERRFLQPTDTDWKRLSVTQSIPPNALEAIIRVGAYDGAGEAEFDDLKIELLPGN